MQVLGSMEVERIFSTLFFMKNKLWNCLANHLETIVEMYFQ
jgi:hypothetical protein